MNQDLGPRFSRTRVRVPVTLGLALMSLGLADVASSQTASTGALTGVTLGVSTEVVSGVLVRVSSDNGVETRSTISDEEGRFGFLLLPPGGYHLQTEKANFESLILSDLHISVTETLRVQLHLSLRTHFETVNVSATSAMVHTDSSALGRVFDEASIGDLPLSTRNFTQITGLSPGVTVAVYNAGELGTGATALSQIGRSNDGIYVHGSRSYDNNWQLDGISISDVQGSGSISGGIPIPNPDTLEEFKVQTGLYDAAFGRAAGANVSVITKSGTDTYHGTIFEFLRNDSLNANDYFLKEAGQRRPALKQNQFGFTVGGPIQKHKLLFFTSYQGTRQVNGIAAGQPRVACTASLFEPALTNDRSARTLGQLFGAMQGALGGVAVKPDGSNINPVALALLNFKLPDGSFLIPTPQKLDPLQPFARRGFSAFTQPCRFSEDQGFARGDYAISERSRLAAHLLLADDRQSVTFPGGPLVTTGNIHGFLNHGNSQFAVLSLAHSYVLSNSLLNDAKFGWVHTSTTMDADAPFKWSEVGVAESEMNRNNELPSLSIAGSVSMASVLPRTYDQDSLVLSDVISLVAGPHSLKFGGSLTRLLDDLDFAGGGSSVQFLSWPDFLLGLNGTSNGTTSFSNLFASSDLFGLFNRKFRVWEGSVFAQDDLRITRSLTLNLGTRYERIGQFGDDLGRNSSFDSRKADRNPPPSGSLDGYIVPANFSGTVPAGVTRTTNTFGTYGEGQNAVAPRIGVAWQILPRGTRMVMRGGYGLYYSRPTGQAATQSVLSVPFALTRISSGTSNAAATFQAPFAQPFPTPGSFPLFVPYSASTAIGINALAPDFRPALVQQFSLNLETELHHGWLLETGYVGTRGTHLQRFRSLNQALDASPTDPIRGTISNALSNIGLRVPIPGIRADSLRQLESEGSSWYNAMELSLTKRLSHGLQFLASYTFSKSLDTDGADVNSTSAANSLTLGDQNSARERWGRASFDRTHRFVFSTTWAIPTPSHGFLRAALGNWVLAALTTIQSGSALTIADTNSTNVFGINEDRAQLSGACSNDQLVSRGSVERKLNGYFNASCFAPPPVIGADGVGRGFGDSATGMVNGPGQANLDLAISKFVELRWPMEKNTVQFRAEFFNALNHPQFANPDSTFTSPTFGVISSTSVNARVGQVSLRLAF
jgi:TonB-dependent receptor-like protein/carboxypeptidase family protein